MGNHARDESSVAAYEKRCPSRSPESLTECGLPDDADSHRAGHESRRYGRSPHEWVSWATSDRDYVRWAAQIEAETGVNPLAVGCAGDD